MADFFTFLTKRNHQKKFKAFLRYFEGLDPDPGEYVKFSRKVVNGPSLPGWLCSDRPLVPLILRVDGSVQDAEPNVYRACSCSPQIGGDVLKASTSKEARLFFLFPELLVILSFVESLTDEEALIAENAGHQGLPVGFCFLDTFSENSNRQFEDKFLLRELNKAFAAFLHEPPSSSTTNRGTTNHFETKKLQKTPSSTKASSSSSKLEDISNKQRSGERRRSSTSQSSSKLLGSQTSSRSSMKTASQSSIEPFLPLRDDHYYTADEDSEGMSGSGSSRRPSTQEVSLSRSAESIGFVLGEGSEGEDSSLPQHERLDDFRKRIRKRTRRRLSRRSSRSSYLTSSGSSDMEDISEDPEDMHHSCCRVHALRPASSEPSVLLALDESTSPLSPGAALLSLGVGRKMMVTSSNGHLKAYSYDGVAPNLPVPFKAKFRRRRHHSNEEGGRSFEEEQPIPCCWRRKSSTPSLDPSKRLPVAVEACCEEEGDNQLKVTILWLAASMADLQALILYTLGHSQLREVSSVYGKVRSREWTVGDLSCEVLRFCRNRLYPSRKPQQLFHQIIGQTSSSLSQESLD